MYKLETELKNQRKPGFQPGVSGNPTGKPKGARCRVTVLAEKLMADNAQDIIQATIDAAKNGDSVAMRLCVERLVPIRKWVPAPVDLPTSDSLSGVVAALNEIAELVASGKLDIESGVPLTKSPLPCLRFDIHRCHEGLSWCAGSQRRDLRGTRFLQQLSECRATCRQRNAQRWPCQSSDGAAEQRWCLPG